jgi:hypothetical protein
MEMLAQLTVASLLIYEKQEEYEQNVIIKKKKKKKKKNIFWKFNLVKIGFDAEKEIEVKIHERDKPERSGFILF